NLILGEAGDDEIRTAGGNDVVWADEGNDLIIGSSFGETFYGGEGQDTIYGGGGNDWARYNDATSGVDVSLKDGTGTRGEALNDLLVDIEFVWGSEFADTLEGDDGVNQIRGGAGDDTIIGLKANDILQGYEGADTFVFHIDDGIDRINEFEIGADTIRITGISGFGDLTISTFQGDAAVAYDQGDVVILTGIAAAEVQASWFEFG
ncbi:MAG: calcium-binding protein, partial [Pseudomonadota bacterium]